MPERKFYAQTQVMPQDLRLSGLLELRAGRLSAALDVFEKDPLPQQDPMWDCPNLLLTPHVAGNMTLPYTLERIVELFLEDFENYCAGRPLCRAVNPQKGY